MLAESLSRTTTAVLPLVGPVSTPHGTVTVIPWIPAAAPVSWAELGTLLRRFHLEHAATPVPDWVPLPRLVGQVSGLRGKDATSRLHAPDALLAIVTGVRSELRHGVIHGDASPLNVLRSAGSPADRPGLGGERPPGVRPRLRRAPGPRR